jgi:glycosidase
MSRYHFLLFVFFVGTALANPERLPSVYDNRMADWRTHQVVYQVYVDRFATATPPRAADYPPPRRLRAWTEAPKKGSFVPEAKVWSHELDFWGGTLRGLLSRLDYIQSVGADVLYLNPIFFAFTNHKYDAVDYFRIDPAYGTQADFQALCDDAHRRGMKVVLDGVFNHVSNRNSWFTEAAGNPASMFRRYFTFDEKVPGGYVCWANAPSLPELDYRSESVRDVIYRKADSVVQSYLRQMDGWRLDVANELGPQILTELTTAAHRARPGSFTVGEIYNYPSGWIPALDGVMDMHLTRIVMDLIGGRIPARVASEMIQVLVDDVGIEGLLRSWLVFSNHDRHRLKTDLPALADRTFVLALQVALPGSPLVYYGEEVGLTGGDDPEQRGPMDWTRAADPKTPELQLTRQLLGIRNSHRALQVGDFHRVPSEHLLAFTRYTDSVRDTVLVVANPTATEVHETLTTRDWRLMDENPLHDLLSAATSEVHSGLANVTVPPHTVQLLVPVIRDGPGYNRYKRVP